MASFLPVLARYDAALSVDPRAAGAEPRANGATGHSSGAADRLVAVDRSVRVALALDRLHPNHALDVLRDPLGVTSEPRRPGRVESHQYSGVPRTRLAVALAASAAALVAPVAVSSAAVAAVDNHITQASVATPESGPNGSFARAISNDGRYVVFASHQPNLVPSAPGDVGRYVYLRDTQTDTTTRLSHGTDGYLIGNAAISGNGRYVVFASKEGPFDQAALRLVNT